MAATSNNAIPFKEATVSVARLHFVVLALFAIQTIIYHAAKVAVPEVIHERWLATSALLIVTAVVWYVAKNKVPQAQAIKGLLWVLIVADIAFAAFNVNLTRGYASNAVILFIIPILVAAIMRSRSALIATALLCVAVYGGTILNYFFQNFNEGYMSELYGELLLYAGLFLVTAHMLWAIVKIKQS